MGLFNRKKNDDPAPKSPLARNSAADPAAPGAASASAPAGGGDTGVRIEITPPAPDAEIAKLALDRSISPGGSVYFTNADDAQGWPLVERVFGIDGVHSVLAKENVLILSRKNPTTWDALLPAAEQTISDYYAENPDADLRVESGQVDEADIRRRVREVLDAEINPAVASHGGVIRLLDVQGTRVFLQLGGGCQGCGMAAVTLREGVERAIRTKVPEVTEILDTTDHAAGTNPYYK